MYVELLPPGWLNTMLLDLASELSLLAFFMYPATSVELALRETLERNVLNYNWLWQKETRLAPTITPARAVLDAVKRLLEVSVVNSPTWRPSAHTESAQPRTAGGRSCAQDVPPRRGRGSRCEW